MLGAFDLCLFFGCVLSFFILSLQLVLKHLFDLFLLLDRYFGNGLLLHQDHRVLGSERLRRLTHSGGFRIPLTTSFDVSDALVVLDEHFHFLVAGIGRLLQLDLDEVVWTFEVLSFRVDNLLWQDTRHLECLLGTGRKSGLPEEFIIDAVLYLKFRDVHIGCSCLLKCAHKLSKDCCCRENL